MKDQPGVGTPEGDDTTWGRLSMPLRALIVGVAALTLFAPFLGWAPIYLAHDEVVYALNAHAIATSGRGMSGEPWPLYFHVGGTFWAERCISAKVFRGSRNTGGSISSNSVVRTCWLAHVA